MKRIEVKKAHTLIGHTDAIYTLEAISDRRFISAGGDGMVVLWDVSQSEEAGEVVAKTETSIYALAYHNQTDTIFIGQNEDGIRAIKLGDKTEIGSIQLGKHQIFDIQCHKDQIWVALASGEMVVLGHDLSVIQRVKYSDERVRNIDFFGDVAAVSFSDHTIRIIDTANYDVMHQLKAHANSVFAGKFHPSGKYLISGGRDAHIKIWDTQADYVLRESIQAHLYTVNDLVFSKDGRYFVSGSMDKAIKLWDAYNFKLLKVLDKQRHAAHGNSVNKLLWMNYHDLLVTCSDDRTISVWDLKMEE